MARLYFAIIYLCLNFGEVCSLLDLADSLDMTYVKAWKRLKRLEESDHRLRVSRHGRGVPMKITYDISGLPDRWVLGGITVSRDRLYRNIHEDYGRTSDEQRHPSLV